MVKKVDNNNFDAEVLKAGEPVLVDFYADWCGPCKMVAPILEEIANENTNIKVCKVNVDEAQDLAVKFGVASIPTLIVFKDGEVSVKNVGALPKDKILSLVK